MNSALIKTLTLMVGLIALAFGFWLAINQQHDVPLISEEIGIVYPHAREIGKFQLIDSEGQTIDEQRFQEKWWLVYFGFTFCPDACPIALSDMKKIKALLDEKTNKEFGFAFISVDPDRDTPERLKQYVEYFDPEFLAATGNPEDLQNLATKVGVVFIVPENPADENYVVDHSTFMVLWNSDANLKAIFKAPHKPKEVARGIKKILSAS